MEAQGEVLREQTNGLLWGEVVVFTQENVTYHEFRIASSRLKDYRCVLLRTAQGKHVYPLFIYDYSESDDTIKERRYEVVNTNTLFERAFKPLTHSVVVENTKNQFAAAPPDYQASDYSEFKDIFTTILQSKGTRAIIQSLLIQGDSSPTQIKNK